MNTTVVSPLLPPPDLKMPRRLGHRLALDGLRGLAVLAVLANHLALPFSERGALGVDVFFVLSGFLISSLLCEEWIRNGKIQLRKFYLRRILRLYPALLLMVFIVSWITPAKAYVVASLTYTTNWMMALHWQPLNLELGHTWTLSIEEQYYVLWPPILILMLRYLSPRKALLIPIAFGLLSAVLRILLWHENGDFWRINAGIDTHADGLLLGSALGMASAFGLFPISSPTSRWMPRFLLLFTGTLFYTCVIDLQPQSFFSYAGVLLTVLTSLLLIGTTILYPLPWLVRLLEFRPLVWMGNVSYGLYLWQVPILVLLDLEKLGVDPLLAITIKVGLIFTITFLSYRYLERPIQKLKERFKAK
jgi:peptidoglycan/LPS O-acetylase OafA/YrhL